ncbi:Uncharacterised protein [Sphingobacterium daejeonense]|nr:Uncharacterised protein [Sphingobacterium daejeonense]
MVLAYYQTCHAYGVNFWLLCIFYRYIMPLGFKKHITPTAYNAAGIESIDGWWGHQPWRPDC